MLTPPSLRRPVAALEKAEGVSLHPKTTASPAYFLALSPGKGTDFYKYIDALPGATEREIRKAYRGLSMAMQWVSGRSCGW